ncbi:hypothetical protein CCL11_24305 [Pseudomonas syringae]|nr:hypothetical protein CCL11_24305 [Pseudomonas syringae]
MRSSFLTLQRGNAVRDALRRKEDAERPERHANAEHWHDGWLKRFRLVRTQALYPCLSLREQARFHFPQVNINAAPDTAHAGCPAVGLSLPIAY